MFAVTILGNNSALPMHDRHPTSQVVTIDEYSFLIDCGEGTQIQMNRYKIRRSRIAHIFISHLHGDHYFGLPGLLNSFSLTNRTDDLHLYAPPALESILSRIFEVADTKLTYTLCFHPLEKDGLIMDGKKLSVHCFKVQHRIDCWGFLFREKEKLRKVDTLKAKEYLVPSSFYSRLKEGEDYTRPDGSIIANTLVTRPAPYAKSYAYCADTKYDENIAEIVKGTSLIYHESTYLQEHEDRAALRFHSTAGQAATIAQKAGVSNLIIGHFSSKYNDLTPFLEEASAIFPNTELALEGTTYLVR
jgi:ribonuclease Z